MPDVKYKENDMTLEECYRLIDGDYEGTVKRLYSESFLQKMIFKFLEDQSFQKLADALQREEREEAFRAAHTLKGVCQNLGFTRLYEWSAELTEGLREEWNEEVPSLFDKAELEYRRIIEVIKAFQMETLNREVEI